MLLEKSAAMAGALLYIVSTLLGTWPDATKDKNKVGRLPLHTACGHGARLEVVTILLSTWPDAAKKRQIRPDTSSHSSRHGGSLE
mmetsp:Transcript_12289/g.18215  ORF Transcript_12289/g.18215 Transcript_12289/m.18215 type:complete len:85 (-) Transcript_12289:352-606(-)